MFLLFYRIHISSEPQVWAEENLHWIVLIIVIMMVVIMALVVGCLLYRRHRQVRQEPEMKRQPTPTVSQQQGPGNSISFPRQRTMDIASESEEGVEGGDEGVEGQPADVTGFGTIEMAQYQSQ